MAPSYSAAIKAVSAPHFGFHPPLTPWEIQICVLGQGEADWCLAYPLIVGL